MKKEHLALMQRGYRSEARMDEQKRSSKGLGNEASSAPRPTPGKQSRDATHASVHRDPNRAGASRALRKPRRSDEDALFAAIAPMAAALAELRRRAAELGIFIEDREPLACEGCGLREDILATGRLVTYFAEPGDDTGLRFAEQAGGTFGCPCCGATVSVPDDPDLRRRDTPAGEAL